MNQTKVDKLLLKLIENRISKQESRELLVWLESEESQNYFNEYVALNHLLNSMQTFENGNGLADKIKKPKNRFRYTKLLKYAAVLFVVAASAFFFKEDLFPTNGPKAPLPVVKNNKIQPGRNTAVLTLEDGSDIALGKGTDYSVGTMDAKEDQLVYSSNGKAEEVEYNFLTVPRGGQFFLQLSDGSKVWLNSESKLKYPVEFVKGQSREVYLLYGEAYFEAAPSTANTGDDFKVYHKDQEIRVLGTQFNIMAYRDEAEVLTTLVEGKVALHKGKRTFEMEPGQQSRMDLATGAVTMSEIDVFSETSWRSGVFSFKRKPLKDIMRTLSRWYDMEVYFENKALEDKRFKGVLKKNQSIEEVLSAIMSSSMHSYEINEKTVLLK